MKHQPLLVLLPNRPHMQLADDEFTKGLRVGL